MGKTHNPLRGAVTRARALVERGLPEPDVFACLFSKIARRVAAAGGLDENCAADLLAERSLPRGTANEIDQMLAQPELESRWQAEETLGWAYQYWQESERGQIFRRLMRDKQKIAPGEVPAATQLFTPVWITRFLVQNTLGRLWLDMHPDSQLAEMLDALVPLPDAAPPELLRPVKEIRVLDPACGTMHFGLAAFDLLAAMYREELERAGQPGWPEQPSVRAAGEIPAAVLEHNLTGADIDARALRLARAALLLKAWKAGARGQPGAGKLSLLPGPVGSLDRASLMGAYDCIVTNPPYMIQRNMDAALAAFLKREFPPAKGDFYSAFILRCLELLRPGGLAGLLTQASFLFLPSYTSLRAELRDGAELETLLHTGPRAFEGVGGEKVNTAAFVLRRAEGETRLSKRDAVCFRLARERNPESKRLAFEQALAELRSGGQPEQVFCFHPGMIEGMPEQPWVYWAAEGALRAFGRFPDLSRVPGTDGNKTGDNARFIRDLSSLTPEEAASGRWRRLARPARQEPYCQDYHQVVDWSPEARDFYRENPSSSAAPDDLVGRAGISWSRIASRRFTARRFPAGVIPDVSTPAIYPEESQSAALTALMNSTAGRYLLKIINPTINNALGDVRRLPVPPVSNEENERLRGWVEQLEVLYSQPELDRQAIERVEEQVDELAFQLYEFSEEDIRLARAELRPPGVK